MPKIKHCIIISFLLNDISANVLKILTHGISWRGNRKDWHQASRMGFRACPGKIYSPWGYIFPEAIGG